VEILKNKKRDTKVLNSFRRCGIPELRSRRAIRLLDLLTPIKTKTLNTNVNRVKSSGG